MIPAALKSALWRKGGELLNRPFNVSAGLNQRRRGGASFLTLLAASTPAPSGLKRALVLALCPRSRPRSEWLAGLSALS